ncbi:MAG: MarR family winged helix-turn-helix transcriptional regulator [Pseudomonadota bacterium]|nr:MarR family winged helix-turn-helix transcriptional regulator [Pseudomonadota bacterium]
MLSTELTRKSPRAGYDLPDSRSLAIVAMMEPFQKRVLEKLVDFLKSHGFVDLKPSQITFLAALDCDENHASNVARALGVSRQAVHKSVKEMEAAGWLETLPNPTLKNQRTIHFTKEGERMMSLARRLFFDLDKELLEAVGNDGLSAIERLLRF